MDADRRDILLLFLLGNNRIAVYIRQTKITVTLGLVFQLHNAPDSATKQAVIFFRIIIRNWHIAKAKIRELCKEAILLDIQMHRYHINDGMTSVLAQLGENFLRFIRADKIIR